MKKFAFSLLMAVAYYCQPQFLHAAEAVPFKVAVTGSGAPIIFIPGLASGGNVWDGAVAHFKGHYQCHVLTLAGFAGQPAISGPFLDKVRGGIVQYIHDQKLNHPVIIGHSLGGMMAFWVASTAPADVGPIISVDGAPFYPALMNPAATSASVVPMAEQLRSLENGLTQEQFAANNHQFLAMLVTASADADKIASLGDKSNPKAVGQAFYELFTNDLRPGLRAIQAPVLLLGSYNGADDDAKKAKVQEAYAAQIANVPHHKLVFAPTAHHFIQYDDPAFFYRETEAFLKQHQH